MSMRESIFESMRDDIVHTLRWPIRVVEDVQETIAGGTAAANLYSQGIFASPDQWNLSAYRWLWTESNFFFESYPGPNAGLGEYWRQFTNSYLANSLRLSIPTVLFSMALIIPGAYTLSRNDFKGRKGLLYGYVMLTQVGGGLGIAALVALYVVFNAAGITNSHLALAMFYSAGAVPFNTWLLKTFMDNIPESYTEAAIMDGASRGRIVWEIILPLTKPGLAVVLIFTFLAGWNEFIVAQVMLGADGYPLSVGLYALTDEFATPWAQFAAYALVYATPVALIYFFSQRYVESGLSFGGMEG
ncbi:arabinogalactan oligomer / maltooligosaccharide transport system permease protein [Natronoarchaeum philippinense]|uniref:Arabinogalactan oligomer / maltooligosaccharide transport system permease protein n=1 Tax=Natronoarchaeum philippinense TaxID=558529 RepID=A0A285P2C2_NATPI|nr:ABC transporter permease subunit [Natronoarchaeum philippinense]SNZ15875.1 arabinogalactan oligomer / maltooligosaccharide transport system permease protein [Natronoarchaeum philippinense]